MTRRCLVVGHEPLHQGWCDVLTGLAARGWSIDISTRPSPAPPAGRTWRLLHSGRACRHPVGLAVVRTLRRVHREVAGAATSTAWFHEIEQGVATGRYAAVLAFMDVAPVGLASLLVRLHPAPLFVSMIALTQELRLRHPLRLLRMAARLAAGPLHPDVLRPLHDHQGALTLVPSKSWRDAAVAAGHPSDCVRVVRLGVDVPEQIPERSEAISSPARLLWVGRLSPEKGLHLFLGALPLLGARPVSLAVIAAPGSDGYATFIEQTISRLGLRSMVQMFAALPRAEMIDALAEYDLLLFHSIFDEPVAHVMLHAAAAGLPVVGPASPNPDSPLREGQTAWCYSDQSPRTIADTILRALDAGDDRRVRAHALREEVRAGHNLARTIDAFDTALQECARAAARGGMS